MDHSARLARAYLSLEGLSVGDAFGERFFSSRSTIGAQDSPHGSWRYTDDTEMAIEVFEALRRRGRIDQDELAVAFARRYRRSSNRGYGAGARGILEAIDNGISWKDAAASAFGGAGSFGNGAAMRVAPIGAHFADDFAKAAAEAEASAEVTHAHLEGRAGAIAVAVAAAWASLHCDKSRPSELLKAAIEFTPNGETRSGLMRSLELAPDCSVETAANVLGNGSCATAADTVPFALWCASRCLDDYVEALWTTVAGLGDMDTNCAIVGGIVALSAGRQSIPDDWIAARESLRLELPTTLRNCQMTQ